MASLVNSAGRGMRSSLPSGVQRSTGDLQEWDHPLSGDLMHTVLAKSRTSMGSVCRSASGPAARPARR